MLRIQEHLDDELPLEELAKLSHFSPYHFHRIFRALVGESVHQHVRRLRLELAARQLRGTGRSVTEIAFDSGYETHEAFTRAFKAMFGVSPSQFRDDHTAAAPMTSGEAMSVGVHTEDGDGGMRVEIKTVERRRIAFIRHIGPYDEVGPVFEKLIEWAWRKDLFGADTWVLGVCHDDPEITPAEKIRYDAAITVDGALQPEGEMGVSELAGGEYATACHEGPYTDLGIAYRWLYGQWLPTCGREPADFPPFELYLNNPEDTPPEELLTEIHVPLRPR